MVLCQSWQEKNSKISGDSQTRDWRTIWGIGRTDWNAFALQYYNSALNFICTQVTTIKEIQWSPLEEEIMTKYLKYYLTIALFISI
ncbi:MAG: hypothetical protein Ta2E_12790 [Mycoplasmoidaceae bacterium]|nr:MAG: hypothetical protein Ta2E_12790 [Mycoplasmoidaceae bacterium]